MARKKTPDASTIPPGVEPESSAVQPPMNGGKPRGQSKPAEPKPRVRRKRAEADAAGAGRRRRGSADGHAGLCRSQTRPGIPAPAYAFRRPSARGAASPGGGAESGNGPDPPRGVAGGGAALRAAPGGPDRAGSAPGSDRRPCGADSGNGRGAGPACGAAPGGRRGLTDGRRSAHVLAGGRHGDRRRRRRRASDAGAGGRGCGRIRKGQRPFGRRR